MTFEQAENYIFECKPFLGKKVTAVSLKELDRFLGWAEDIPEPHWKLEKARQAVKTYLSAEHVEARLVAEIEE